MKTTLILILTLISFHSFGQMLRGIISLDSTVVFTSIGRDIEDKYINEKNESKTSYHIYHYYNLYSITDSFEYCRNQYQDSIFYIRYMYKTFCGKPVFVDNEKLKLYISKKDSLYLVQLYDSKERIINAGYSKTIFPFYWEGLLSTYYPDGKLRAEEIYANNKSISTIWRTVDGDKIDTIANFSRIDTEPNFINSRKSFEDSLQRYIAANVIYPESAIDIGLMGRVYVSFIVTKSGRTDCIEVLRGINPVIDIICVNLIKNLPVLQPAMIDNKPVNTQWVKSFSFYID